jgi:hypothetical protein
LLTDRLRVLGPDHPVTLATSNELARWRVQTGIQPTPPTEAAGVGQSAEPDNAA